MKIHDEEINESQKFSDLVTLCTHRSIQFIVSYSPIIDKFSFNVYDSKTNSYSSLATLSTLYRTKDSDISTILSVAFQTLYSQMSKKNQILFKELYPQINVDFYLNFDPQLPQS